MGYRGILLGRTSRFCLLRGTIELVSQSQIIGELSNSGPGHGNFNSSNVESWAMQTQCGGLWNQGLGANAKVNA